MSYLKLEFKCTTREFQEGNIVVLSDLHPISSNHITPESNIKVARIKEVITN